MNQFTNLFFACALLTVATHQAQAQCTTPAPLNISPDKGVTSICPGQSLQLIAIGTPPGTVQIWKKDGAAYKKCECGLLVITEPGVYSAANEMNGCASAEVTLTITQAANCGSTGSGGGNSGSNGSGSNGSGSGSGSGSNSGGSTPTANPNNLGTYVGINVTNTGQTFNNNAGGSYSLAVNGKVLAQEVRVRTGWADYVFDKAYALRPLADVEAYIRANHHLPGVPSAAKVEAEGIQVGEMHAVLLSKIEELTLYVIRQQKEIEALKKQVKKK